MNDLSYRTPELVGFESSAMVPIGYAEKSMASLMQLHTELMDEKERRVDLYRRLMDKEQALAELKMYVQLLEEKIAKQGEDGSRTHRVASPAPSAKNSNGNRTGFQAKPPPPPRTNGRERARFALKPRRADGQASSPQAESAPSDLPRTAASVDSFDARFDPPRGETERTGTDGWRTW
ncbi:MAG TPA: hypothetical protein VF947_05520 [Myxococcales bacterium]